MFIAVHAQSLTQTVDNGSTDCRVTYADGEKQTWIFAQVMHGDATSSLSGHCCEKKSR